MMRPDVELLVSNNYQNCRQPNFCYDVIEMLAVNGSATTSDVLITSFAKYYNSVRA